MFYQKCVVLGLFNLLVLGSSQRTKDSIYSSIDGASCFKRLNGTHSTGCTSDFGGSRGVIHLVTKDSDIEFLLNAPPSPPYIPVITPQLFTRSNVLKFKELGTEIISGVVLINNRTQLETFSHESTCPNQYGGLIEKQSCDASNQNSTWNPFGTNLMNEDFDFPIFYVSHSKEVQKLVDCYQKFNSFDMKNQHSRSVCSVEIKTLMSAAGSSEVCVRRSNSIKNLQPTKYCDPLSGTSVYGTLFETSDAHTETETDTDEKFILVSTRMDTSSLFEHHYIGAMSSLIPITTLIGTAQFLNAVLTEQDSATYNILFMFFNGEAFDYIGSQRFLYDVKKGLFPGSKLKKKIDLQNIAFMIDVGTLDDLRTINVYHATEFDQAQKINELLNRYNNAFEYGIKISDKLQDNMPPFSAQTFLKENISFPAVIATSVPENKFYNSIYDDAINLNYIYLNRSKDFMELENLNSNTEVDNVQYRIRNVSTLLGQVLYEFVTGKKYTEQNGVNVGLIDEFLHCFLITSNCTLFKVVSEYEDVVLPDVIFNRYIGVGTAQEATVYIHQILGFVLGRKINKTKDECNAINNQWFNGVHMHGECKVVTNNFTKAVSPAFEEENYDWTSHKYSTWTESTWMEISARIYLRPTRMHEAFSLTIGFVVMIISFILVFLINSRSDILFADSVSTTPITPPANC